MKDIEILYFDGCPTHEATVNLVHELVESLDLDARVTELNVATDQQAVELEFIGSPSVRVDGQDVEPAARESQAFGRRCRVYAGEDGSRGVPPNDMVRAALLGQPYEASPVAAQDRTSVASSCCCGPSAAVRLLVAEWCPQCPASKTFWSEVTKQRGVRLEVIDIESAEGAQLAAEHSVRGVPAVIIGGKVAFRSEVPSRAAALERIESVG